MDRANLFYLILSRWGDDAYEDAVIKQKVWEELQKQFNEENAALHEEITTSTSTSVTATVAPTSEEAELTETTLPSGCVTASGQGGRCIDVTDCASTVYVSVPWWEGDPEPNCGGSSASIQCCVPVAEPCKGRVGRDGFCLPIASCGLENTNFQPVPWQEGDPEPSCRRYPGDIQCCLCTATRCRGIIGDDGGFRV